MPFFNDVRLNIVRGLRVMGMPESFAVEMTESSIGFSVSVTRRVTGAG